MPEVHVLPCQSFDEIEHLAIAIQEINKQQRHIGIFFRPYDETLQMIHLAWHGDFRCHEAKTNYHGVLCTGIHPIVLQNMADWLITVWRENGSAIPYSIKPYDEDPFDESGRLRHLEPGDGFTCATFVLWVFWHSSINLLSTGQKS